GVVTFRYWARLTSDAPPDCQNHQDSQHQQRIDPGNPLPARLLDTQVVAAHKTAFSVTGNSCPTVGAASLGDHWGNLLSCHRRHYSTRVAPETKFAISLESTM